MCIFLNYTVLKLGKIHIKYLTIYFYHQTCLCYLITHNAVFVSKMGPDVGYIHLSHTVGVDAADM